MADHYHTHHSTHKGIAIVQTTQFPGSFLIIEREIRDVSGKYVEKSTLTVQQRLEFDSLSDVQHYIDCLTEEGLRLYQTEEEFKQQFLLLMTTAMATMRLTMTRLMLMAKQKNVRDDALRTAKAFVHAVDQDYERAEMLLDDASAQEMFELLKTCSGNRKMAKNYVQIIRQAQLK